ncbi:MAG TPA: alpha-N-arabinofuranosidase [Planctomycetota bacterium]|jgi:alpha-N-arabinofuranosidase
MPSKLIVNGDQGRYRINRNIYGHFAEHLGRCIYEGLWVGEGSPIPNTRGIRNDVVAALKKLKIPVLRWPGGCFADTYHWKDGIGPRDQRPSIVNIHWGGVTENNHFGTHEFFDLCEQLGCEPYVCGNVGSGTVQEMSEWLQYITFGGRSPMSDLRAANGRAEPWKIRYWGVGNENWGCGGSMRAEYYADVYRQYQTYLRGEGLEKIACGPNSSDYHWTEVLMREAAWGMSQLALHYYCGTGSESKSATLFGDNDWLCLMRQAWKMEELVTRHSSIMDRYDPARRVGLAVDEWGAWHEVEKGTNPSFLYQQNTLRDAMVAALTLNIFNNHASRVTMGNIAQTVNVLQSMCLTEGEKMVLTPSYHVFAMYTPHQDATLLPTWLECDDLESRGEKFPALSVSASRNAAGKVHLSLCNMSPGQAVELDCDLHGIKASSVSGKILSAPVINAHNTFDKPNAVKPKGFNDARLSGRRLRVSLPAHSVVVLALA